MKLKPIWKKTKRILSFNQNGNHKRNILDNRVDGVYDYTLYYSDYSKAEWGDLLGVSTETLRMRLKPFYQRYPYFIGKKNIF